MKKKLFKNKKEEKFLGVCAGVAEYFDIDVSIVRILTVIAVLLWGSGLIVYIALAIILPDKSELDMYSKKDQTKKKNSDEIKSVFDE